MVIEHILNDQLAMRKLYRVLKSNVDDEVKEYESFKTVIMVFHQQCKVTEGNETLPCEITIREKPEGEEIVSSPHKTDARYEKIETSYRRTRLQLIFAAIACNVKRFIRHGILYGYMVAAQTAGSHTFSFVRWFFNLFFTPRFAKILFSC